MAYSLARSGGKWGEYPPGYEPRRHEEKLQP